MDGTIVRWAVFVGGQKEMASSTTTCFGFVEIASITVDVKDHVAYGVRDDGIFLGCYVVQ